MFNLFRFNSNFKKNREKFTHFMSYVQQFKQSNEVDDEYQKHIFSDFMKVALKPIQAKHMTYAYSCAEHSAPESIYIDDWFNNNTSLHNFFVPVNTRNHLLCLKHDIVLPTVWSPRSIVLNTGQIADGFHDFVQNDNHYVTILLPFRIGFVRGGNHSIALGILNGNGSIIPDKAIDITPLLKEINFNGTHWVMENKIIGQPRYVEFGWVWEVYKYLYNVNNS